MRTSGAIQIANTRSPIAMLAQGRTIRRESSRGHIHTHMAARTTTHIEASQYGLMRWRLEIARNVKNPRNGARYRTEGYFATEEIPVSAPSTRLTDLIDEGTDLTLLVGSGRAL